MKKIFLFSFVLFFCATNFCFSKDSSTLSKLFHIEIDTKQNISDEELSIINFILSHTYENNIHKMRGETENQVYTNEKTGQEYVYDGNGKLVTNPYNQGSYNYGNYNEPFKKFYLDILPWLRYGNAKNDPTNFGERLYAYIWDLDYGIQSYIFNTEKIETVSYKKLSQNEKEIAHFFYQIFFNETYDITLSQENLEQLRNDGDFYFSYLDQIFFFLGFELN